MSKPKIGSSYFQEHLNELQGGIIDTIEAHFHHSKCGFYSFTTPLRDHPAPGDKITGIDIQSVPHGAVFGVRIDDDEILTLGELEMQTLIRVLVILENGSFNRTPSAN